MTASTGPVQSATAERDDGSSAAIRVRALRKNYGPVVAIDDVDLDIMRGEFFTLLGPSGSYAHAPKLDHPRMGLPIFSRTHRTIPE